MPTGIAALIVTLQPILTNALAGKFLGEKVSFKQWIGVILGFIGAALVLGFDIGVKSSCFWSNSFFYSSSSYYNIYFMAKKNK